MTGAEMRAAMEQVLLKHTMLPADPEWKDRLLAELVAAATPRKPQSTPEDISSTDGLADGCSIVMWFPPTTPYGPMADIFSKVADIWTDEGQGRGWEAELATAPGDVAGLGPEPGEERTGGYERPHP